MEHGDVDGVFEAEVEEDADDEERVAEFFDPDGGAQQEFDGESQPRADAQDCGTQQELRDGEALEFVEMKNEVEGGAFGPRAAFHFPPKTDEVEEGQLELNHALGPGQARAELCGRFVAATDAQQAIDGKRGAGRRKDQEEAGDAEERVAAVENEKIALVDGSEAEVDDDTADAGAETQGERNGGEDENHEERVDGEIGRRNYRKQIQAHAGFDRMHGGGADPGMRAVPGEPVAAEQERGGEDQQAVDDAEDGDVQRRLGLEEKFVPRGGEGFEAHCKSSGCTS